MNSLMPTLTLQIPRNTFSKAWYLLLAAYENDAVTLNYQAAGDLKAVNKAVTYK